MARIFLGAAALFGLLAVVLGAFGAHALEGKMSESLQSAYETAVSYQFYHTLALLAVGILMLNWPLSRGLQVSGIAFITGMLLFCGSLYVLATTELRHLGPLPIGILTPVGGMAFIVGWLALFQACYKNVV